jgi:hypothetical protein
MRRFKGKWEADESAQNATGALGGHGSLPRPGMVATCLTEGTARGNALIREEPMRYEDEDKIGWT